MRRVFDLTLPDSLHAMQSTTSGQGPITAKLTRQSASAGLMVRGMRAWAAFCLAVALQTPVVAATGIIETLAGGGVGDGLPAKDQSIEPAGIVLDAAGNVYISEGFGDRVRRVDAITGLISTVAGNGPPGVFVKPAPSHFCGDGGPATEACLDNPAGLAIDASGGLLIADTYNARIRRVDPITGIITTIAGNGTTGPCADDIPATSTCLSEPLGVTVDADGNLFISAGDRIRRVDAQSGVISTVAGGGSAACSDGGLATTVSLDFPTAVAVDPSGNLFITDSGNAVVCRVDAVSHSTSVLANVEGNAIVLDGAGNAFIADNSNDVVQRIDAGTGLRSIVAGMPDNYYCSPGGDGGLATAACIGSPSGVALDAAGNLFIAASYTVRRVDEMTQIISTVAGTGQPGLCGEGGPATNACLGLSAIAGVAVDSHRDIFIADGLFDRIWRVDGVTEIIRTLVATQTPAFCGGVASSSPACFGEISGVAVDAADHVFATVERDAGGSIVQVDPVTGTATVVAGGGENYEGVFCGDGGPATQACLWSPSGAAIDSGGNLYIADRGNNRIRRVDAVTHVISTVAGGAQTASFCGDGGPATAACLRGPSSVAIDRDGDIFIADSFNGRIRRVDAVSRAITTVAGNGSPPGGLPKNEEYFCGDGGPATAACLYEPSAVLVDPAGNLFVADERNRRVRRVDATTGTITTVAGSNVRGFCGDGGPATSACLLHPVGLAMDALGNLLIADDSRIRRVQCVPDTDGDGLCDAYDLSDLGGLTLQMAFVRSAHKPSRQLLVRFRAMLDTRTYAAANSGVSFVDQARNTGLGLSLYASPTPPSLTTSPLVRVRFSPADCAFRRTTARCTKKRLHLTLDETSRAGVLHVAGELRGVDGTVPTAGPLRLVLNGNDAGALDYQDAAEGCSHTARAPMQLRCAGGR